MAHQAHALPWNTLASNFKYVPSTPHSPATIVARNLPTQGNQLNHFARVFSAQVSKFSITERAKQSSQTSYKTQATTWLSSAADPPSPFPPPQNEKASKPRPKPTSPPFSPPETRQVYTDSIATTYNLSTTAQNIHSWIHQAQTSIPSGSYNTAHGPLADITKVLLGITSQPPSLSHPQQHQQQQHATEILLLLANHPCIPLLALRNLSWGHHFGFGRVAESAVAGYLFFGLLVALQEGGHDLCAEVADPSLPGAPLRKRYMVTRPWRTMMGRVCGGGDYDAQTGVHRGFLWEGGNEREEVDLMADLGRVREYMGMLWRLMVVYDFVVREAGGDPSWEQEIVCSLSMIFDVTSVWDPETGIKRFA